MKKLFLIEKKDQLSAAQKLQPTAEDAVWVAASEELKKYFESAGFPVMWAGDAENAEAVDRINEKAWEMARRWHSGGRFADVLQYQGINIGKLTELYFGIYLGWLIKNLDRIRHILDRYPGAVPVVFAPLSDKSHQPSLPFFPVKEELIFGEICDSLGRPAEKILYQASSEVWNFTSEPVKNALRGSLGWIYQMCLRRLGKKKDKRVLFCGAPQHVKEVMKRLKSFAEVIYFDEEFRLAKCPFFLNERIAYYSYQDIKNSMDTQARSRIADFTSACEKLFQEYETITRAEGSFRAGAADLSTLIRPRMHYLLFCRATQIAEMIEVFLKKLKEWEIDAVVVDEDTVTFRKTLVSAAKNCGIPSIQIPHGVNLTTVQFDLFPVSSDYVALGGEAIKEYYLQHQEPLQKLRVTGVPRYDHFSLINRDQCREMVCRKLDFRRDSKILLLALTALSETLDLQRRRSELDCMIDDLCRAASLLRDWRIIVRPHPLERKTYLVEQIREAWPSSQVRVVNDRTPEQLLMAADLVVTPPSNMMIEALVNGKPIIVMDYFKHERTAIPYFQRNQINFIAKNYPEFMRLLQRAVSSDAGFSQECRSAAEWFQKEWVGPLDGRSGQRVADAIANCMESR